MIKSPTTIQNFNVSALTSNSSTGTTGKSSSSTDTSSSTSTDSTTTQSKDLMSQDVFLQLLITQMEHQDPLDPMKNEDFINQLAQLSTVEQLRTVNSNLQLLQLYQSSINNAQSVGLIGKEIKALGNSFSFTQGDEASMSFRLADDAARVEVNVKNSMGNVVRALSFNNLKKGSNQVTWDGKDNNASPCASGDYTFEIKAYDDADNEISVQTLIQGKVTGITFEDGSPKLQVGSSLISISDIYEVK